MTGSRRNRLQEIDRARLSPLQEEVLTRLEQRRGRIVSPYKVWLHTPRIAEGMEVVGTGLNKESTLTLAELEIAVLSTAVFWNSPYVVNNHTRHALKSGLGQPVVDAILAGETVTINDPRLQLVADFVHDALVGKGSIEDAAFDTYERELGRTVIAELLVAIGYYTSVALAMRFHEATPNAD